MMEKIGGRLVTTHMDCRERYSKKTLSQMIHEALDKGPGNELRRKMKGVIGSGTVPFPISFNHVLSGFAQFDSTVSNDDLWNADLALFISNSSIRCGGEGHTCYHIGIGY